METAFMQGGFFVFPKIGKMIFAYEMIYLTNTTAAQVVFIPRDTDFSGTLKFSARSTVGLDTPITATLLDLKVHRTCYAMALSLPEGVAAGEYEYRLTAGGNLVSTGVMVVKDSRPEEEQYNKTIEYEQYNGQ